jgi:hypothetical protein
VCYDFQRGLCTRGNACRYAHDGASAGSSGSGVGKALSVEAEAAEAMAKDNAEQRKWEEEQQQQQQQYETDQASHNERLREAFRQAPAMVTVATGGVESCNGWYRKAGILNSGKPTYRKVTQQGLDEAEDDMYGAPLCGIFYGVVPTPGADGQLLEGWMIRHQTHAQTAHAHCLYYAFSPSPSPPDAGWQVCYVPQAGWMGGAPSTQGAENEPAPVIQSIWE